MSAPAKLLKLMIQGCQPEDRVVQFCSLLDVTKVIPQEELTPEKAFYWRMMALIFAREEDGVYQKHILPELPCFLEYFSSYILKKEDQQVDPKSWKFMATELVIILGVYVLSHDNINGYNCKTLKHFLKTTLVPGFLTSSIEAFIEKLENIPTGEVDMEDMVIIFPVPVYKTTTKKLRKEEQRLKMLIRQEEHQSLKGKLH